MGRTKSERFTLEQNAFSAYNKCLGCPGRLAILEFLLSRRKSSLGQIIETIDLHPVTVRKHLEELVNAGFAEAHVGRNLLYSANNTTFQEWFGKVNSMANKFQNVANGSIQKPSVEKAAPPQIAVEPELDYTMFRPRADYRGYELIPLEERMPKPDQE